MVVRLLPNVCLLVWFNQFVFVGGRNEYLLGRQHLKEGSDIEKRNERENVLVELIFTSVIISFRPSRRFISSDRGRNHSFYYHLHGQLMCLIIIRGRACL